VDWLATAKNWILRDNADGKLVKNQVMLEEERKKDFFDLDAMINQMYG